MAGKCVHKACGKTFDDPEEDCVYHPGPPVFHEGQKGRYLGVQAIPYLFSRVYLQATFILELQTRVLCNLI